MTTTHLDNARRYVSPDAPAYVAEALARCYAWRPFAQHTPEERTAHAADLAIVHAYEESRDAVDLAGPDPMGDA